MTKEDYREKVEEHRQEIDLHNESGTKMSRVSRHRKKNGKKQTNPIMTMLTVVLIFIPLVILAYVWLIYEPNTSASEKVNVDKKDDLVVEIQKQEPKTQASATDGDEEKEDTNDDNTAEVDEAEAEKERVAAEEAKKAEARIASEKAAKEAAEIKKAEEAQKVAAAKAKEQEAKKKAEQEAKKKAAQEAVKAQRKTHTVQSTDNLYRIALKYYGSGSPEYVNKIKAANNLSSDSIATGQVLVIVP